MDKNKNDTKKNNKNRLSKLFVPTYHVELLFSEIPKIIPNNILTKLQKECGQTTIEADTPDFLVFAFEDGALKQKDSNESPRCVLIKKDTSINYETVDKAVQQTWDWPEKEKILKKCKFKIGLSDFKSSELDSITRLKLFNNTLVSILSSTNCLAIHWVNSQKLVSPKTFVSALNDSGVQDYLYGALNVRLYVIDENSGEFLMDTFGMGAFGLPDLQCHFRELNPEDVAGVLINYGYYIFEKGDIISDGHTVQGITEEHRWQCNHIKSMMSPFRKVLDLNPGMEHAGINRVK